MTTNLFYSVALTIVVGIYSITTFDFSNENSSTLEFNNIIANQNNLSAFKIDMAQDSVPSHSSSRETYRTKHNGKRVFLSIIDGKITKFKINGRKIPSSQYGEYATMIEELRESAKAPTPPTPPTPTSEIAVAHMPTAEHHHDTAVQDGNVSDAIADAMVKDGLITDEENYKMILSRKKFKVNGKTQDQATHKKYIELYEALTGREMSDKTKYQITRSNSSF